MIARRQPVPATDEAILAARQRTASLGDLARIAARAAFAVLLVLSPFRAQIELLARPIPPVYSDFTDLLLFWSDIAALVTLAAWLVSLIAEPRPIGTGPRFVTLPLAGLVVVAAIGVPFSLDPGLAAVQAIHLAGLALLGLYVLNEVRLRDLVGPVSIMVAIQAAVAIAQVLGQHSIGLPALGELDLRPDQSVSVVTDGAGVRLLRGYGLSDHPNILGGLLAAGLLLVGGWFVTLERPARQRRQLALAVVFAIGTAGLFLTFSRSAWLAFGAGLVVAALVVRSTGTSASIRRPGALVAVGALAAAPLLIAFLPWVLARTGTQGAIATETRSVAERVAVADVSLDVALAHPLVGVGIGVLPEAMALAQPQFAYDVQPASLVPLDAAAETGILGAVLLVLAMIAPWVALGRRRLAATAELAIASAMLAVVTVVGLFDYYTWTYEPGRIWLWITFGLWAAAYVRATRSDSTPVPHAG